MGVESQSLNVLVADTDPDLRASIGFTLTQAGHEVQTAESAESVIGIINRQPTDLLLLDMNMTPPNSIELCRTIRRHSSVPIMMLAARDVEEDLVGALDAGADDYIRKPFSPRTLIARVRALARRAQPLFVDVISVGSLRLDLEQHTLSVGGSGEIHLTPLELKVVQVLIASPGRTVTSERLLAQLWGGASERERHTLKQLIYRLRSKLAVSADASILQTTPGSGYRLVVE